MNYRHAFHAGNFADVFKHALLARVLTYLIQKPAPLRFIDTHAGIGVYDLTGEEASRTGEWRDGIGRLDRTALPGDIADLLAPYLGAVGPRGADGSWRTYPGSPGLAQWILRPEDRLSLCELHPADAKTLKSLLGRDRRVQVLPGDGYAGLKALLPPRERRGLVLIDPPFESPDEFETVLTATLRATRIWSTGTYMLWYPLKNEAAVSRFSQGLVAAGLRRVLQLHLMVADGGSGASLAKVSGVGIQQAAGASRPLAGAGLVIVNPPYTLKAEAERLLPFLAERLGRSDRSAWSSHWLAEE